jgi:hypothetical protein
VTALAIYLPCGSTSVRCSHWFFYFLLSAWPSSSPQRCTDVRLPFCPPKWRWNNPSTLFSFLNSFNQNSTSTTTDTVNAKFSSKSVHVQSASCLITPSEISNPKRQFDTSIVVRRPSTARLISTHRKENKEWHRKRKKKLINRRRTYMTRWVFLASSNLRFEGETD